MTSMSHVQRVRLLYKTILRLHRGMPADIRELGNSYVRDEFKRHKSCNPAESHVFMKEWAGYATSIAEQLGLRGPHMAQPLGKGLNEKDLERLRDEQIYQLYELMIAATGKGNDDDDDCTKTT